MKLAYRQLAHDPGACRYLISQHPEVEQKILAELDSLELLRSSTRVKPRELTYADLSKLTYLNAVIKVLHQRFPCRSCCLHPLLLP